MRILDRLFGPPEPSRPSSPVAPPPPPLDVYRPDPAGFRLLAQDGRLLDLPRDGSTFPIGRSSGSALKLDAECVSRQHALGAYRDGQLWVCDRGSRNGTWLSGERLPPKTWVAVPSGATLDFGGPAGRLHWGEPPQPLQVLGSDGQPRALPAEGQVMLIGRKQEAGLRFDASETGVSRRHAELKLEGGQLFIRDTHSQNGTTLNSRSLEPGRWVAVPAGARLQFGSSPTAALSVQGTLPPPPREPVRETRLPDGRTAFVQQLADGRLRVSKVDAELSREALAKQELTQCGEGFQKVRSDALETGMQVLLQHKGRPHIMTVLGTTAQGVRFGHTDEYTAEDFQNYLQAQQDHLEAQARENAERAARRAEGRAALYAKESERLGLTPDMPPLEVAGRLFNGHGRLAADGVDLWPAEVQDLVESWKRRQLDAQPVQTLEGQPSTLGAAGLTEIRLQQWLAEQRGEFLLFRGIQGAFDPSGESRFWTNELGSAMGYAEDPSQEANLLMMRIPRSDIPRYYRNVGCLPGRNPYAEVYEIDVKQHDARHQPVPALNSNEPRHSPIFAAYRVNKMIQDDAAGHADFRRLDHALRGDYES